MTAKNARRLSVGPINRQLKEVLSVVKYVAEVNGGFQVNFRPSSNEYFNYEVVTNELTNLGYNVKVYPNNQTIDINWELTA